MDRVETLQALVQKSVPGWRFVKEIHYRKFRSERTDAGERLGRAHDLPLWCDRVVAESSGTLPAEVLVGTEPRLCLYPIPRPMPTESQLPWVVGKAAYTALLMEALRNLGFEALKVRWRDLDQTLRNDAAYIVLRDHRVPPDVPTDDENHAAFAVEFLTAWRYTPSRLPLMFPMVLDPDELAGKLAEGIDESAIWERAQLPRMGQGNDQPVVGHPEWRRPVELPKSDAKHAVSALRNGNAARAAIDFTRAADEPAAQAAVAEQLVPTLAKVFGWDSPKQAEWSAALRPVVRAAAAPGWNPAAKFLYDLQTIAKDLAQDLYAVDPPGWFLSLGRRPMLRKLTLQRQTILLTGLHRASGHLNRATLPDVARDKLDGLLEHESDHAEADLRRELEPRIAASFEAAGLIPATQVERLARDKVIAELLDHVCERGHIRMGDLRDALARNALKMPDLAGPVELFRGDALLRADAMLARELDGIYHRGEIYLRTFQRGSAAFFGTAIGRFLTLFALIPFIAAFMTVAFAQYLEHEGQTIAGAISNLVRSQDPEVDYYAGVNDRGEWDWIAEVKPKHSAIQFTPTAWLSIGILALFYLLLVNVPRVRQAVFTLLKFIGRCLHFLLFSLPALLWWSKLARRIRRNRLARILTRWLFVPLIFAGLATGFVALFGGSETLVTRCFVGVFGILAVLMATPFGQLLRDGTEEAASDAWLNLRYSVLPGILSLVAWFFREVLGRFQSLLYTVDEWFRYREGESKPNLVLKTILGIVWFPIAYIFRFAIFLLIEPQINPIKHFPTVTVSHKLLLPMIPSVAGATQINEGLVAAVFTGIPGVFGFLVWELKENWKLYSANRRPNLGAVQLGHHGETMRGLLRPGFHSGTIPKDYRKIHQAIRKAEVTGGSPYAPKPLASLHSVEHAVHLFVERELVDLLHRVPCCRPLFPTWSHVQLGVQTVRIEFGITHPKEDDVPPAVLTFQHEDGVILGQLDADGLESLMDAEQRAVWHMAVRGLFAKAAVTGEYENVDWIEWRDYWEKACGSAVAG